MLSHLRVGFALVFYANIFKWGKPVGVSEVFAMKMNLAFVWVGFFFFEDLNMYKEYVS